MNRRNLPVLVLLTFIAIARGEVGPSTASMSPEQISGATRLSGCELLNHPSRYNGKMVVLEGNYTVGFERSDLTFQCDGSVNIQVSLSPPDLKKYGFLTEQSTIDAMLQLPKGERPGDNLTARKLRRAVVKVVGLFRCRYDFPSCKGASRHDGSVIVKVMQFMSPLSDVPYK